MIAHANPLLDELETICEHRVLDSFAEFFAGRSLPPDSQLAELIDVDARALLASGRVVEMNRYLQAVPELDRLPISLDAAIEFTLRSWSASPQPTPDAVSRLEQLYPRFATSIRNAAALSQGLATTRGLHAPGSPRRNEPALPSDFGPAVHHGRARYRLVRRLGEGSQGLVYLAVDRLLSDAGNQAMVAIKLLDPDGRTEADRWRTMDEATKARRIHHPNVVSVLDRGSCDGQDYIIYEYVSGGDLESWRRGQGAISARRAAGLIARIGRGVQAAHAAGLVHRDLKPGNVLMAGPGPAGDYEPKITDFGVATAVGPRDLVPTDERVGNLAFIAPEQYRNQETGWTAPVDVYALGGMLYYLLTGLLPNGNSASEVGATHDIEHGRAAAPELISPADGCDHDLVAICRKALSPKVEDRYQTAEALSNDLDRWLAFEPLPTFRPGPARRARLLIRRCPRMVALTTLAILAILTSAGLAIRWQFKAATASAYALAEKTHRDFATQVLNYATYTFTQNQKEDISGDWLPALDVLESIAGPYMFDPQTIGREPQSRKLLLGAARIKAVEKSGCLSSIEALLWSDVVAFWLLRTGDYARAEALLDKYDPRFNAILLPEDPWRNKRRALHDVAAAQRLLAEAAAGRAPGGRAEEVEDLVTGLRADEQYCAAAHFGDALHRFVIAHLVKLYDPAALDRPAELAWATRRVEEIRAAFTKVQLPPLPVGPEPARR